MTDDNTSLPTIVHDLRTFLDYQQTIGVTAVPLTPELETFLAGRPLRPEPRFKATSPPVESLVDIQRDMTACSRCVLHQQRGTLVFGQGNMEADLLLVGGWPTNTDALWNGEAGALLDKMLGAINLDRDQVYMATVVKCCPDADSTPQADEIRACLPYLKRQIEAVAPKVICAMGSLAAQALLNTDESLIRLRGRFHPLRLNDNRSIQLMPTFDPGFLLRNPEMKRPCWKDLLMIQRAVRR